VCKNREMGSERNRELGDRCGFCLRCGWGRRFMGANAATLPAECPDCGGEVLTACKSCGAGIGSLMALTCAECGAELRPERLFGVDIRRKPERHRRLDVRRSASDNERTPL